MAIVPRYAIYYAPLAGTGLDRFGASLLGYDAWTGDDLPFPDEAIKTAPDWHGLTDDPRKYGFHGTLKAPFVLADGRTEHELRAACAAFANVLRPVPKISPVLDVIGGFIALVPAERSRALDRLAADCVESFDDLRATLTPPERARRTPASLTPKQCGYLDRWGYPYVMDEFRFHMTLTGRLDTARRAGVLAMLRRCFSELRLERLAIDRIALFRQADATSRFRIIAHWPLRATAQRDG
jgi:putative phosphonate metabolism protein